MLEARRFNNLISYLRQFNQKRYNIDMHATDGTNP